MRKEWQIAILSVKAFLSLAWFMCFRCNCSCHYRGTSTPKKCSPMRGSSSRLKWMLALTPVLLRDIYILAKLSYKVQQQRLLVEQLKREAEVTRISVSQVLNIVEYTIQIFPTKSQACKDLQRFCSEHQQEVRQGQVIQNIR